MSAAEKVEKLIQQKMISLSDCEPSTAKIMLLRTQNLDPFVQDAMFRSVDADRRDRVLRVRDREQRVLMLASGVLQTVFLRGYAPVESARNCRICPDSNGKPTVTFFDGEKTPHQISVTHTDNLALLFSAQACSVGVDAEPLPGKGKKRSSNFSALRLAARFFAEEEAAALEQLSEAEQHKAFLWMWTRKEALGKADGRGISAGTGRMHVLENMSVFDGTQYHLFSWVMDEENNLTVVGSLADCAAADGQYFVSAAVYSQTD